MPQLAWMANSDGFIFWYNKGWYDYTGTTPERMEGWGWQSVHDPNELPKVLKRWKASIESAQPFDLVAHLAENIQNFFLGSRGMRWIHERPVMSIHLAGK